MSRYSNTWSRISSGRVASQQLRDGSGVGPGELNNMRDMFPLMSGVYQFRSEYSVGCGRLSCHQSRGESEVTVTA